MGLAPWLSVNVIWGACVTGRKMHQLMIHLWQRHLTPPPHSSLSLYLWLRLHVAVPHLLVTTDRNQPIFLGMTRLTPPLATVNQLS